MGLLIQGERQVLIDLLCKLPGIDVYPHVRHSLTATLPDDLRNTIMYSNALNTDIASIVDMVTEDAWCQLPDGTYPILVVLENALNKVRGSQLEPKLLSQMNIRRERFGLPLKEMQGITPPEPFLDDFLQKLYDLIHLMPTLQNILRETSTIFGRYLVKPRCKAVNARLTLARTPVREFAVTLEQTDNPKVKAYYGWLANALLGFKNQAMVVEGNISQFCDMYGILTGLNQPAASRQDIQNQIFVLLQYSESVVNTAQSLYRELCYHQESLVVGKSGNQ